MDEQQQCDRLEQLCGSIKRAEQLQWMWRGTLTSDEAARIRAFRRRATDGGYSEEAIDLFLIM